MAHSSDLRTRVLQFIENGGSQTEAARRFNIARAAIYQWLNAPDPLACGNPGTRHPRQLDPTALVEHVKAYPDQTLDERAKHFGVSKSCVAYGLRKLEYTRKKTTGYKGVMSTKTGSLSAMEASDNTLIYVDETGSQMKPSEVMAMPPGRTRLWLDTQPKNAHHDFDSGTTE